MSMNKNTKLRKFHQAKWDEPIIFELGEKGERGILMPVVEKAIEAEIGDGISKLPASIVRKKAPALPEIGQMQVLKHYLRMSQENLGADLNVDIGQGTCTMKYNPKINEQFANSHQFADLHPLQDESTVQGMLEVMYKTEHFLEEIS